MERFHQIRREWPVIAIAAFYVYLTFHALSGNQGLMRWVDYENDIITYQAKLEAAQSRRADLESHASALKASQIDLDLLDLKAREYLFATRSEELTIWLDPTP